MGCQAHALNLFIKDLALHDKTPWASFVLARVTTMVNVINEGAAVRALIHEQQLGLYGQVGCVFAGAAHLLARPRLRPDSRAGLTAGR